MDFQTVQLEKATAIARFNRLRTVAFFWRFFEALIAVFVVLSSPSAAKLAGKSVVMLCNYAYTPLFSFVVFNLIIAVIVLLSRWNNREGEEREREGERGTVPGLVVFDESDFEIAPAAAAPVPEDLKMVVFSEIGGKIDFPAVAEVADENRKMVGFSEIGGKIDFPAGAEVAEEDRKMVGFSEIGGKIDSPAVAEVADENRRMVGFSEIGGKIDFPAVAEVAGEDKKMVGFSEIGGKIDFLGVADVAEEYRKMVGFSEIGEKKIDFPAVAEVAEEDRKMVVFSEIGRKIDFLATVPPCVAAAEAAIEEARRRIRRFERTQSARLRQDMETGVPCQQLIRRSETETGVPRQHRLRRSETERAISVIDKVDTLSSEEFRRTIEEFIAKQKKAKKQLIVDI